MIVAGSLWISSVYIYSDRESQQTSVAPNGTFAFGLDLEGEGVAYYILRIDNFANQRIQSEVLDEWGNRIWGRHIDTKMMVNYFRFNETGKYWVKVDNMSDGNLEVYIELGDTRSGDMVLPWVTMLAGLGTVIASVYMGSVFRISSSQRRKSGRRAGKGR